VAAAAGTMTGPRQRRGEAWTMAAAGTATGSAAAAGSEAGKWRQRGRRMMAAAGDATAAVL
jgi:hypothetical protein